VCKTQKPTAVIMLDEKDPCNDKDFAQTRRCISVMHDACMIMWTMYTLVSALAVPRSSRAAETASCLCTLTYTTPAKLATGAGVVPSPDKALHAQLTRKSTRK
jgi:hypothetical protein